jgi:hypothetical protein
LDRIDLAQDGNRWRAVVNMAMKLRVLENVGVAWSAEELLASQEGIWCMKLVSYTVIHAICAFV